MIRLTAQLDDNLAQVAGKQLPFAASLALNRTATGARDAVRDNLPKRFKLRNQWTKGGIQAQMGTKTNLLARVVAPGYMAIQETGGERTPNAAGRTLAAPVADASASRVIPKGKRPRALLAGKAFIIGAKDGDAGVYQRKGKQIRLMWWLSDSQQYEERFEFEADVKAHVGQRFSSNFKTALAQALA